jgi:hypothetical protein
VKISGEYEIFMKVVVSPSLSLLLSTVIRLANQTQFVLTPSENSSG